MPKLTICLSVTNGRKVGPSQIIEQHTYETLLRPLDVQYPKIHLKRFISILKKNYFNVITLNINQILI